MTTLARVQRDFQDYLLRGDPAIAAHVVGSVRVPVATRLQIYSRAYHSRLQEALANNFPALAQLLGEEDFHTLAAHYVAAHDSPFFSIRCYGDACLASSLRTRIMPRRRCWQSSRSGSGP